MPRLDARQPLAWRHVFDLSFLRQFASEPSIGEQDGHEGSGLHRLASCCRRQHLSPLLHGQGGGCCACRLQCGYAGANPINLGPNTSAFLPAP